MHQLFAGLALTLIAATVAAAPDAPAASAAPAPAANTAAGPTLGAVLQELVERPPGQPAGEPVHTFKALPPKAYDWDEGRYRSAVSGVTMKLPQVRDEKVVSIREAVVFVQANGEVETSHVMFVPGAEGTSVDRLGPVSVVVVSRLGNGRPTDRETVLRAWEPRTPEQRKQMEARGIEFHRIKSGSGEGLERIVPNRIVDANFPYLTHTQEGAKLQSVGVTRYLVSGERALLEFSQVFPCRELAAAQCKDAALKASDRFVADLVSFTVLTAARPAAPPASSGK